MSDLRDWLDSIGLGQYADTLAKHDIDSHVLRALSDQELEKLGFSLNHRKRLRKISKDSSKQLDESRAERRHMTVLFCDLVGSTALSAHLDPEDLRIVLREFQRCCSETVRRYEGHIARFMGDGALAYFGFPIAHEDDAERAVNVALEMLESVSALTTPMGQRLEVRIGIASGLVVVGDLIGERPSREFAIVGEAPNLAARLQAIADANQILIAPQTRRLVGKLFDLADLGEHPLKGFDHQVRVWRVLRPSWVTSRFEARQTSPPTPLIGRESELAELQDHFLKARGGNGQMVLISGEPGIGKSRLMMALRDRLPPEDYELLSFQASPRHTSSAWHPIIRYLESASGITRDDPPALRLDKLEAFVAQHIPETSRSTVPLLSALLLIPTSDRYVPLELTPQQQKNRLFGALLALFEALCARQPVILIFEDVQWIDPTSLELLERVRDHVHNWRMLAILLMRPELTLSWADQPHVARMTINRLDRTQVTTLVEMLSAGRGLSRTIIDLIVTKTDGVPLFAEEMTKAVLEAGKADAGPAMAELPFILAVPDTLHDSLMARLDQLAPMKTVAQIAAGIGREFSLDLLKVIVPLGRRDLHAAIDRLVASGLVFRSGPAANQVYTFKHALVQDEAYASMLREERRELHVRIAEALSTRFVDTAEAAPELVAHHFTQAGEIQPAVDHWLKAAREASKRSAFVEAANQLRTALALLTKLPETLDRDQLELQLQHLLGNALNVVKGFGAAETGEAYKRALELCDKFEDSPRTVEVLTGMIGYHLQRGEFEQARDLAEDLLARASRLGDSTLKLMGHRALGVSLFVIGELEATQEQLRQSLALYDIDRHGPLALVFSHDFKATALAHMALSSVLLGEIGAGLALGRNALDHAERLRHPHSICYVLAFLTGTNVILGEPKVAYSMAERTIALATEYDFPQWLAGARMLRGWVRVELGDVDQGLAEIRQSVDALEAVGTRIWVQFAHYLLAQAVAKAGQTQAAVERVDRALAEIGASGRWYQADLYRLKGDMILAGEGSAAAAEACYEKAIAVSTRQGARLLQLRAMTALGELWRSQGRSSQARERLAPLFASFSAEGTSADLVRARALLMETV